MNREEKAAAVEELARDLGEAQAIFAVDYKGISVSEAAELRRRLREADAAFRVVKNRLAKRAAEQAGADGLDGLLTGPTALTLIKGDPVTVAKAITTFAREHEVPTYKGGIMDGAELDPESFQAIAKLPGVDQLRGQLVGLTASPLTGLAAGMGNLLSGLGRQLAQIADQGLVGGSAPPADEAATAEALSEGEEPASEGDDAPPAEEGEGPSAAEEQGEEASEAPEEADSAETDEEKED